MGREIFDTQKSPVFHYMPPPWACILLLGIIIFYTNDARISYDLGEYLNCALNLYNGNGYTTIDGDPVLFRGPVFPLMIAASYRLSGVSVWSAFWIIRLFCILNPLMIYLLGRKLFGKREGFAAALFVLTSYSISHWSYRHIDAVWSFFALAALLSAYNAFEKRKLSAFILTGVLMAVSYLTKESAILLMPLPLLLFLPVKAYRNKENLFGLLAYLLTLLMLILPWTAYTYMQTATLKFSLLGAGSDKVPLTLSIADTLQFYLKGLAAYYSEGTQSLAANFMTAPLFIIAWGHILFQAFRKKRPAILLMIFLLLLSPYISVVGRNDFRVGQLIIFLVVSYLCLAAAITAFSRTVGSWTEKMLPKAKHAGTAISIFLICILIFVQVFASKGRDRGAAVFFQRSALWAHISGENRGKTVRGIFNESHYRMADWVKRTDPQGEAFMFSHSSDMKALYFLTGGKCKAEPLPLTWFDIQKPGLPPYTRFQQYKKPEKVALQCYGEKGLDDIIFLSSQKGAPRPRNKYFWVMYESCLTDRINKERIRYVVAGPKLHFFCRYLDTSPFFQAAASFSGNRYRIYRVLENPASACHDIYITKRTLRWLQNLKRDIPDLFHRYIESGFRERLGISPDIVTMLADGKLPEDFTKVDYVYTAK